MRSLRLLWAVLGLARVVSANTVWIDTDVSIGSPIREVDDAYALVLAFHSPEIRIAGVSATYGNAPLSATTRVAQNMVRRFGGPAGVASERVFAGAASASDLGRRTAASDALAATLEKQKIVYIALGPLTNLATFLQLHPRRRSESSALFLWAVRRRETISPSDHIDPSTFTTRTYSRIQPRCRRCYMRTSRSRLSRSRPVRASRSIQGFARAGKKRGRRRVSFAPEQGLALVLDEFRQDKRRSDF